MKAENNFKELLANLDQMSSDIQKTEFSTIEKDIVLEKIRNIYEHTLYSIAVEAKIEYQKPEIVEIAAPVIVEEKAVIIPEPVIAAIEVEVPVVITEPVAIETPVEIPAEETPLIVVAEEPVAIIEPEAKEPEIILTDEKPVMTEQTVSGSAAALNEILAKLKTQNDVMSQLRMKPITSLKTALSINDRIMFTRELFGNNSELYHHTIDEINKFEKLEQVLPLLSVKIDFEKQNESMEKFVEVLFRRFITTDSSLK